MDFTLSKEHEMARALFREFAEKEVKPLAIEVDETEVFPRETVEKMAKAGFMGIPVPKEYGGQGCDILTYAMCVEELAKVCGTTAVIVSAHTSLCCDPILTFGTEDQKKKYLPDLASGKKIGAFGLTEPGAGTDAQGQQTKAVLDGDEWVLNGSKIFITNGKEADVYVIFAITGMVEKRGRMTKEISAFIVVFDEPTSGLDLFHMRQVASVVNQVADTGRTALVVTHDPEFILRCCNYVLHLENGQIQESYSIENNDGRNRLLKFFLNDMEKEVSTE